MGLREKLNRNPMVMGFAAVVLVVVAVWVVYRTATDKGLTADQPTHYYFTTDDGKTLFSAPDDERAAIREGRQDGGPGPRLHL